MKTKKSIAFYVFLSILFCIVYIFTAALPLGTEYQFEPVWKTDVSVQKVVPPAPGDKPLYFVLGQTMGYFTKDGRITSFTTFPFKASISQAYYTQYTADSTSEVFYHADGTEAGTIVSSGFPYFDDDRIYVFLPGGSSFVMCGSDGAVKWEYDGTVPITAFDSCRSGCVAGFADGTLRSFSGEDGSVLQSFAPGGSDFSVILGAAISSDGSMIAAVCGQDRQRFILAKKDGLQTKIIFHEFIAGHDPRQRLVQFSSDDSAVWYSCDSGLGIVNTSSGKHAVLKMNGQAFSLQEAGNLTYVLCKDKTKYTVYAVEKFDTLCASFSFTAQTAFIRTDGSDLFVGKDASISCMTVEKK